jgi:hypothetical protein
MFGRLSKLFTLLAARKASVKPMPLVAAGASSDPAICRLERTWGRMLNGADTRPLFRTPTVSPGNVAANAGPMLAPGTGVCRKISRNLSHDWIYTSRN